jgi:hypothetical protein
MEEYEQTETELFKDVSPRGFGVISFQDNSKQECSLQDSSLATEPAIWLGINIADPKLFTSGRGWEDYLIPPDVMINTRMHLTQSMVKQLLPFLIKFSETGDYVMRDDNFIALPERKTT